jgi:peptidoglycan/xylan/chitin deacetylase (PgdA/CDA1 family)
VQKISRAPAARVLRGWPRRAVGMPVALVALLLLRWTTCKAGIALVYHRVEPDPPDRRPQLAARHGAELFSSQLEHLRAHYDVVAASDLPRAVEQRRRGQPFPAAITFDDDLRSHVDVALPILHSLGLKAAFFLCDGSPRIGSGFWWERLQAAFEAGIPLTRFVANATDLHSTAMEIQGMSPAERQRVATELRRQVPSRPAWAGMQPGDVRRLADEGHEIGFHTRRHDSLPGLDDGQLREALVEGREQLADAAGTSIESISYPHGAADDRVATAARAEGYLAGFTTSGAALTPARDPLLIGRREPSFESLGHFAVQLVRMLWASRRAGGAAVG